MNEYTPDRWVVISITRNKNVDIRPDVYRMFGSWYGGYLGSNSWRLNSGITKMVDKGDHYEVHGNSGSVYFCYKKCYGTSGYGAGVLNDMIDNAKNVATIEVLPEDTDFLAIDFANV